MCGNSFVDVLDSGRDACARVPTSSSTHACLLHGGNTLLVNELPRRFTLVAQARVATPFHVR
jgi:hypothetical protein